MLHIYAKMSKPINHSFKIKSILNAKSILLKNIRTYQNQFY